MRNILSVSVRQKLAIVGFWTVVWVLYLRSSTQTQSATHSQRIEGVVYVKTHKTGSTAIYRSLHKFGNYLGRKTILFPKPFIGGYPAYFKKEFLVSQNGEEAQPAPNFQSIVGHFRYDKKEVEMAVVDNPKYVTIVRNPLTQFESAFQYYYGIFYHIIPEFLRIPCIGEPYLQITKGKFRVNISSYISMAENKIDSSYAWFFRSKNHQSFDLGMNPALENEALILDYVKQLDSKFDLVMITEYFLESLILLKDLLNMDWHHLTVELVMVGNYKKHEFTEREKSIIRKFHKQDYILYEYFNRTFWEKVEKYGINRMKKDTKILQKHIDEFRSQPIKPKKTTQEKNNEKISRTKRDFGVDLHYIPHENRNEHIERLKERILTECKPDGNCASEETVHKIAEAMYENQGWCPQ